MFRLLHTADWHVGKTIARRSRLDEARQVLEEIVSLAVQEEVDALLVCGDVFEHQGPAAEAEELVYEVLLALERHGIPVVLIPGNHDDPRRWKAVEPLLRRCSVTVVPEVRRPPDCYVSLQARDGTPLQVVAVPWVHERRWNVALELLELAGEPYQTYADRMSALLRTACQAVDPARCSVLAAHLYVDGSRLGGGERSLTVGQTYAVQAPQLPMVQYVALGHVHRPQRLDAQVPTAYSGSPLQLDFGETGDTKSVVIVELEPGLPARYREAPLTAGRRLRQIRGTLDQVLAAESDPDAEWLRVVVDCTGPQPGLAEQVREALPNALEVKVEYPRLEPEPRPSLEGQSPRQQFERYLLQTHKAPPSPELLDLFEQVLEEVS